jgi:protein-disulfide isomerase
MDGARSDDDVWPQPIRLPGQGEPPRNYPQPTAHHEPAVVDDAADVFGAEAAAAALRERIAAVRAGHVRLAADDAPLLTPPFSPEHDRIDGPAWAKTTIVVFGAFATPSARPLGRLLAHLRDQWTDTRVAWRHFPDPDAHPRAAIFALAAEAAATTGHFWTLTHQLLDLHHDDPDHLFEAMVRAGLDSDRMTTLMQAGTGTDRIADDVASAMSSGVIFSPALFIDGELHRGDLDPKAIAAALEARKHAGG